MLDHKEKSNSHTCEWPSSPLVHMFGDRLERCTEKLERYLSFLPTKFSLIRMAQDML